MTAAGEPVVLGYRPELDGLRALSIAVVFALHVDVFIYDGSLGVRGGSLGVDVFFVLSGFLITTLLLAEVDRSGGVARRAFYARRFARLFPALVLTVVATGITALALDSPVLRRDYWTGAIGGVLYLSNWQLHAGVALGPFGHLWTLAIEEQFYLVWPLVIGVLAPRVGRVGRLVVLSGLWVAFVGWCLLLSVRSHDVIRTFFSTDTHGAVAVIAGAVLAAAYALGVERRWRVRSSVTAGVAAGGVVSLGYLVVEAPFTAAIHNEAAFVPVTLGAVAVVVGALDRRTRWAAVLRLRPLVLLGRISYGAYVWHFVVIELVAEQLDDSQVGATALAVVATLVLAIASYRLVEMPVRRRVDAWLRRQTWNRLARVGEVIRPGLGVRP